MFLRVWDVFCRRRVETPTQTFLCYFYLNHQRRTFSCKVNPLNSYCKKYLHVCTRVLCLPPCPSHMVLITLGMDWPIWQWKWDIDLSLCQSSRGGCTGGWVTLWWMYVCEAWCNHTAAACVSGRADKDRPVMKPRKDPEIMEVNREFILRVTWINVSASYFGLYDIDIKKSKRNASQHTWTTWSCLDWVGLHWMLFIINNFFL